MNTTNKSFVLPEELEIGDVIRYTSGTITYLIHQIDHAPGQRSIKMLQIVGEGNSKKYSFDPKIDIINELNKKGLPGRDWSREVVLIMRGHEIPPPEHIHSVK
jgi:hypothetical protein